MFCEISNPSLCFYRVPTNLESHQNWFGQGKSEKILYINISVFCSCIVIVTFFNQVRLLPVLGKSKLLCKNVAE